MRLLKNREIPIDKWNAFLTDSQFKSVFQTPDFYFLCNKVPGLKAEVYALEENNLLVALCVVTLQKESGIKSLFSRRAIIYGGIVLSERSHEQTLEYMLVSISRAFKNRSIYIEIRNLNDYGFYKELFNKEKWQYLPYQNYIVDCTDEEKLFNKLGNNRKRQINKAFASGVSIKVGENLNEINEFYSILKKLYSKKIKKPLPGKTFFEEILKSDFGKFLLVMFNNKIIGGIVCPILEGYCIYEFYVGGLDEEFKNQYPSTIATWAAMDYASKNHIPFFDFMGAGRKDCNYGVREFKSRFGGKLVEYGRYTKINNILLYKIGIIALKLKGINIR